jgi:DNA-directed RNA polymerase specialized sigma24 family protein
LSHLTEQRTKKEVTPEKFAEFLGWLSPEKNESGEEYRLLWSRLFMFFVNRKCLFAEDLADETINRVCLKIGEETVVNKAAFVYGFAKNVYLESLRKEKKHLNIDDLKIAAREREEEKDYAGDCLDKCLGDLGELPDEKRRLILGYFSKDKQAKIDFRKQIAARLQTTQTAMRMQIVRIKDELRSCLKKCLAA